MSTNYTLAVDALGSETKLEDICQGLSMSLERNINYKYLLFGDEKKIKNCLSKYRILTKSTEVINCEQIVSMSDVPSEVLKTKKNSSMAEAIHSVSKNQSDAVLSFGNTGALMTFALLMIKTLKKNKKTSNCIDLA